jgi:tetratricopeptide (TPR) repeat protein
VITLGLVGLVTAVYGRGARNDFVLYDDDEYIYENPWIRQGLTPQTAAWAFEGPHAANYHPLTWISHMLDWEWFGFWAGGHHLESMAIHAASAVVLFWALRLMTGTLWSSAAVAALFALHPLHVESVAWAAERKDVLSGLFWMLTLLAYGWYARRPGIVRYVLVFLAMALGFLSKAMLVSLPCVLLLLDVWPLGRWRLGAARQPARAAAAPRTAGRRQRVAARRQRLAAAQQRPGVSQQRPAPAAAGTPGVSAGWLLLEKLPLVALALTAAGMAVRGQSDVHVVSGLGDMSLDVRLANAAVAYVSYLGKMFWPAGLATFYPHPGILHHGLTWRLGVTGALGGVFLAVLTAGVVWAARRRRYLAVGWFWYLGALVPVIGLMQVGTQAMADRYTYLPIVGIYIALVWTAKDAADRWPAARRALAVAGPVLLVACVLLTWRQVGIWRNTYTLFEHAVRVTEDNYFAYNSLGRQYEADSRLAASKDPQKRAALEDRLQGRVDLTAPDCANRLLDLAADQFRAALDIYPDYDFGNNNLGVIYAHHGELEKADACFQRALAANHQYADVCNNLAGVRLRQAEALAQRANDADRRQRLLKEALGYAQESVRLRPDKVMHVHNLARSQRALGNLDLAAKTLKQVLLADPACIPAYLDLAGVAREQKRADEAVACLQQLFQHLPEDTGTGEILPILAAAHNDLATIYAKQGETVKAQQERRETIACLEQLSALVPASATIHRDLANLYHQEGDMVKTAEHAREFERIQRAHPPAAP